jgi:hypothetical protein
MQKLAGTAITELVKGGKLKRADILLAHSRGSYWGWLVRLGTSCYWNHAFILYVVSGSNKDYREALIVDPRMGFIHADNISYYFGNPNRYDVAVKRLDKEWFQNDSEEGPTPYCQTVCDIAWRETTDKSDSRLLRVSHGIIRQIRLTYRFVRRMMKYPMPRKKQFSSITKRLKVSAYGCGGFVQWSYYEGVSRTLQESQDKIKLNDVIFNPRLDKTVILDDLLATTPADLAKSDKLSWKYVVKNGEVWEVSSEEEVNLILK